MKAILYGYDVIHKPMQDVASMDDIYSRATFQWSSTTLAGDHHTLRRVQCPPHAGVPVSE